MAAFGEKYSFFIIVILISTAVLNFFIPAASSGEEITNEHVMNDETLNYPDPGKGLFIENRGQFQNEFTFIGTTGFGHIALGADSVFLNFAEVLIEGSDDQSVVVDGNVLKYVFESAGSVEPVGAGPVEHRSTFLLGSGRESWVSDVPAYRMVVYEELYDGIDLRYYFTGEGPKYEFVLNPGADPARIRIRVEGHSSLNIINNDLVIALENGDLVYDRDLAVYYESDKKPIRAGFVVLDRNTYSFELGNYDRNKPVIIDPLIYSTFISGNNWEHGRGIAYDSGGNAYVTGQTISTDFPTTAGAYDQTQNGKMDVYVSKLNPSGTSLLYSTYVGGSDDEWGYGITVDSGGNAYVTGNTKSTNFPTTSDAYDTTHNGDWDVFALKLNSAGSNLLYSTFLGGSGAETAYRIEIDSSNYAYITGKTSSTAFPTTAGAYDTSHNGMDDVFVLKLNLSGDSVVKSTFVGGISGERGQDLVLDANLNIYVTGYSDFVSSNAFPTTAGAYDTSHNGLEDVIIFKLNSSFDKLLYSTFVGGSSAERGLGIEIDGSGYAYVAGWTKSSGFPITAGAYDNTYKGTQMAYSLKLNTTGKDLIYSTFLGGGGNDQANDLALDSGGFVYIIGSTSSTNYPVTSDADNATHSGGILDLFLTKLNNDGGSLVYSSFKGGSSTDYGYAVRLDSDGTLFIAGTSSSSDFPTTPGVYQPSRKGGDEAIAVKINFKVPFPSPSGLTAVMGKGFVQLNWNSAAGAPGLLGYKVFRGISQGSETLLLTLGNVTQYNDTSITNGQVYYYYVKAFNQTSESFPSNTVKAADNIKPAISPAGTPGSATTGDKLTFSAVVTDNIEVSSVFVEYWFGSGGTTNMSMTYAGSNQWKYDISVNHTLEKLNFNISARDTTDNWNSLRGEIEVVDNDKASFGTDNSDATASTGSDFNFKTEVTDNIEVDTVLAVYRFGSGAPSNTSLASVTGSTWTGAIKIPDNFSGTFHYSFSACDTSSNWNDSIGKNIIVYDRDKPIIFSDETPGKAYTGDEFNFRVKVTDNIQVSEVKAEYRFGTQSSTNETMVEGQDGEWTLTITVPDLLEDLHYTFYAADTSFNGNRTDGVYVPVIDNDRPEIVSDDSPTSGTTGDSYKFSVVVADNIGVSGIYVNYRFGDGIVNNVSMSGSGTYTHTITTPFNGIADLWYNFYLLDTSGNDLAGKVKNVLMIDNDPPAFGRDNNPTSTNTGAEYTLSIEAFDNIQVKNVTAEFWFGSQSHSTISMNGQGTIFSVTIGIPVGSEEQLYYRFRSEDSAGNSNTTDAVTVPVYDNIKPVIDVIQDRGFEVGDTVDIMVNCSDNIGIKSIIWEGAPFQGVGNRLTGKVTEPGVFDVKVIVTDEAGNMDYSTFTITVVPAEDTYGEGAGKQEEGSKKLVLGSGMAAVAVVIIIVLLMFIKKKRRKVEPSAQATETQPPLQQVDSGMQVGYDRSMNLQQIPQPQHPGFPRAPAAETSPQPEGLPMQDPTQLSDYQAWQGYEQTPQMASGDLNVPQIQTPVVAQPLTNAYSNCPYCSAPVQQGSLNCTSCGNILM